ncbi:MAG: hypothetical protein QMB03_08245 [Spirosomataceae bacterium]
MTKYKPKTLWTISSVITSAEEYNGGTFSSGNNFTEAGQSDTFNFE